MSWIIKTRFLLIRTATTNITTYCALSRYWAVCKVHLVHFLPYIVEVSLKPCEVDNPASYSEVWGRSFHRCMRPALFLGHQDAANVGQSG